MLDGVLKKPLIFAKKITHMLSEDLKQKRDVFTNNGTEFQNYLKNRYFTHMPDNMICAVFKDFWKFVYILDNEDTETCRKINHWAMIYMLRSSGSLITNAVQQNPENYQIVLTKYAAYLIGLCATYTPLYYALPDETKQAIIAKGKSNHITKLASIFLSTNAYTHIGNMINEIRTQPQEWQIAFSESYQWNIRNWLVDEGRLDVYVNLIIVLLENCKSYDKADNYFDYLVKPSLRDFTLEDGKRLLSVICNNGQLKNRSCAYGYNNEIVSFIVQKFGRDSIDFSTYLSLKFDSSLIYDIDSLSDDNTPAPILDDSEEDNDELPF